MVKILDYGQYSGSTYVVAERVDGESLCTVLDRLRANGHWMPVEVALAITRGVARRSKQRTRRASCIARCAPRT